MATQVLTGSGVNNDVLSWLSTLGNYDLGDRRLALDNRHEDNSTALARMELEQKAREIDNQYELDKERLGLDRANLLRQQRMDAASADLADRQLALQTEQANFNQRDSLASKKMQLVDMLASRSGPQDWVKYNSLLNLLSPPTPERSQSLDVFSILDGLVKESEVRKPGLRADLMGDLGAGGGGTAAPRQQQPYSSFESLGGKTGATTSGGGFNYGGGAGGGAVPTSTYVSGDTGRTDPGGVQSYTLPKEDYFSGVKNETVAGLGKGQGMYTQTGVAGPSLGSDYVGFQVTDPYTKKVYGANDSISAGAPIWIQRLANGGMMRGQMAMAMVGDGRGKEPSENAEIAIAQPSPEGARLIVLNPEQTKRALGKGVKPKRMATGGTIGGGAPEGSTVTYNQYKPEDLGNQPFLQKLTGKMRAQPFTGSFGNELTNPAIGLSKLPWAINLQRYNALNPSEQQATQEAYSTGLGVYWDDLYNQALRAAPRGRTFAPSGYGF